MFLEAKDFLPQLHDLANGGLGIPDSEQDAVGVNLSYGLLLFMVDQCCSFYEDEIAASWTKPSVDAVVYLDSLMQEVVTKKLRLLPCYLGKYLIPQKYWETDWIEENLRTLRLARKYASGPGLEHSWFMSKTIDTMQEFVNHAKQQIYHGIQHAKISATAMGDHDYLSRLSLAEKQLTYHWHNES